MLNSIRAIESVRCTEVVCFSGGPLSEVPLYNNIIYIVIQYYITGVVVLFHVLVHTQLGIPALGFSAINNTPILLHQHNEYVNERVFLRGIKVYEDVIANLASVD